MCVKRRGELGQEWVHVRRGFLVVGPIFRLLKKVALAVVVGKTSYWGIQKGKYADRDRVQG